jgi:hypothetical protein
MITKLIDEHCLDRLETYQTDYRVCYCIECLGQAFRYIKTMKEENPELTFLINFNDKHFSQFYKSEIVINDSDTVCPKCKKVGANLYPLSNKTKAIINTIAMHHHTVALINLEAKRIEKEKENHE